MNKRTEVDSVLKFQQFMIKIERNPAFEMRCEKM